MGQNRPMMQHAPHFCEVLEQYVHRTGYSPGQLQRLSGVPKTTIINWVEGRVRRPRQWSDLLRLARVLRLSRHEASTLLASAGYPSVEELVTLETNHSARNLLAEWTLQESPRHAPAPFQAIHLLPYYVEREVAHSIRRALLSPFHETIYCLHGMAGVGKTTLAAHLAYELRPRFPDGILWARVERSDVMSILQTFASAYGRDVSSYRDLDSRTRIVRELLASKRALIILDDVECSRSIRALLPPTGTCATLLTTRRRDLAVSHGATLFHLRPFAPGRGSDLACFARIMGHGTIAGEEARLQELATLVGHLPLAVAIMASRLAFEPGWSVATFLTRLRQPRRRLAELSIEGQAVSTVIESSIARLSTEQQRFLYSLCLLGEHFTAEDASRMSPYSSEDAQDLMRALYNHSLVLRDTDGTYRLHPLVRDYAREMQEQHLARRERRRVHVTQRAATCPWE